MAIKVVKGADEVGALPRGTWFRVNISKMTWRDKNAVMYYSANKPVKFKMRDGSTIEGVLDETPGAFNPRGKVWIRQAGRKTRKGVLASDIAVWTGFRAPNLFEAYSAFIILSANSASPESVAEARSVARDM